MHMKKSQIAFCALLALCAAGRVHSAPADVEARVEATLARLTFDEKLGQLGLKLVKTRQDFTDSYSVEEMNDEQLAQMDIDFAAISAIDCYMPAGGTETRLAFITEYTDRLMDEEGMTNINRLVSLEKIAVE